MPESNLNNELQTKGNPEIRILTYLIIICTKEFDGMISENNFSLYRLNNNYHTWLPRHEATLSSS